jgi:peptidoglycan hydrolase-like protein with peptidoglycan-binding domain
LRLPFSSTTMQAKRAAHAALAFVTVAVLGVSGTPSNGQANSTPQSSSTKKPAAVHHRRPSKKSSALERAQKVPTPERISEIQTALAKDNLFAGAPNGKWDAATVDAVKKFQESHGLTSTGKLDAKTLQKLGLGSQTAGLAPPTPPVSSSALTAPSPAPVVPPQR